MMKIRPRRIVAVLGVIVLLIGGYVGWQYYKGQQMATSQATSPSSQPNPAPPTGTAISGDYKQAMSKPYQQTLQAMQDMKTNTLALQGGKISLSSYKSGILQSQATFSSAEAFVRANPPTDTKLNPSYQEFLTGITVAKQSMGVVLSGISSLSPSKFYDAREMGKTAQQQIVKGYSHL